MRAAWLMTVLCLPGLVAAAGCDSSSPQRHDQVAQAWRRDQEAHPSAGRPSEAATRQPGRGSAVAVVNDRVITRTALEDLVMRSHGLSALQQLILLTLAEDLAAAEKVTVTDAEVQAEYDRALQELVPEPGEGSGMDRKAREGRLEGLLNDRGVSAEEFRLNMRVNALLRKIAGRHVQVSEADIQAEHQLRYGERVQIRHIQTPTLREINEIVDRLEAGEDFAAVARAYSKNLLTATDGGLLPAFTYVDPSVPDVLRVAAFGLQPGEISKAIKVESEYHVIKLEQRIPGRPINLDAARPELRVQVRDRLVRQKMKQLRDAMVARCEIRILDADLRRAYNQQRERLEGPLPPPAKP